MKRLLPLLLLLTVSSTRAYSQGTPIQQREATVKEFAEDPFLFSTALLLAMDDAVTSGRLTLAQFKTLSVGYFTTVNQTPGNLQEKITAIYDGAGAGQQSLLRLAALKIRQVRRQLADQKAARLKDEEDLLVE